MEFWENKNTNKDEHKEHNIKYLRVHRMDDAYAVRVCV